MACATSCATQDHRTYGECLRAKGLSTASGDTTVSSPPTKPNDALTAKAAAVTPPPCANHKETQHRDAKPPWCNACGWRHAKPGTPAAKLSRPSLTEKVNPR